MVDIFIHDSNENLYTFLQSIVDVNRENSQIKNNNFVFDSITSYEKKERDLKYQSIKIEQSKN